MIVTPGAAPEPIYNQGQIRTLDLPAQLAEREEVAQHPVLWHGPTTLTDVARREPLAALRACLTFPADLPRLEWRHSRSMPEAAAALDPTGFPAPAWVIVLADTVGAFLHAAPGDYRAALTDPEIATGRCEAVSADLAGWLEGAGFAPTLVELRGLVPGLPRDASALWHRYFRKATETADDIQHVVVTVDGLFIDLTGRQFGQRFGGARIASPSALLDDWRCAIAFEDANDFGDPPLFCPVWDGPEIDHDLSRGFGTQPPKVGAQGFRAGARHPGDTGASL